MPTYVINPKRDIIIQKWGYVIEDGAGQGKRVMDDVEHLFAGSDIPGIRCAQIDLSTGGMFARKREFLAVALQSLKEYRMYIGAHDFGHHLEVSWFLTVSPGFMKRSLSKRALGRPEALSQIIPLFDQMDLSVWIQVSETYVGKAVEAILQALKHDTSGLNTKSKGFLSVW
jgi:hypothetical protein